MELTDECIEKIKEKAKEVDHGKLVITILPRPEDKQVYDVIFGQEERVQFSSPDPSWICP
ncbi:hypothetical protein [Leadbettera azotonutricia]|uniref:Uncharacterized protein n=1 Tax=Leadbettera azotonutricia (strain ATCC BAA-888 / DSM 13862 / ZAS-9) TaxID=545695 RepID=F5YF69_LEAAZ|nr:hypothetical protein [Leadbettera azotonutricia]AEF82967.1 hypothetical protein TREAZ_2494 [Leadbettera azotonutricia ZAS-9]